VYLQGEEVLLSSEHLSLRGEHPKFFPKFQRSVHLSSRSCVEQYGGAANSPAHPVRPHRYGCQYRSPTALQAAATSTRTLFGEIQGIRPFIRRVEAGGGRVRATHKGVRGAMPSSWRPRSGV
jgi:hypothetical protein